MKTLVIHPQDVSTAFLSSIYEDKDWTVYDKNYSRSTYEAAIKEHDRIIMLGHGDDYGLYGFGDYIINSRMVYLLREKEVVCIWCNADMFFKKYKLRGFYTGMIISEMDEAYLFCLHDFHYKQIFESNQLFAQSIKENIDNTGLLSNVKEKYIGEGNPIIDFNKQRIYISDDSLFV
jgi:hypothetical protein